MPWTGWTSLRSSCAARGCTGGRDRGRGSADVARPRTPIQRCRCAFPNSLGHWRIDPLVAVAPGDDRPGSEILNVSIGPEADRQLLAPNMRIADIRRG